MSGRAVGWKEPGEDDRRKRRVPRGEVWYKGLSKEQDLQEVNKGLKEMRRKRRERRSRCNGANSFRNVPSQMHPLCGAW